MQIPANKLAELITAKTPERRERIVRQVRHGSTDHPNFYQCFHKPAREFLIGGARDATHILTTIDKLKARRKTKWFATDSQITTEALRSLVKLAPTLHKVSGSFVRPGSRNAVLHLEHGDISVPPNLLIHGERNGRPLIGALRFYLAKESSYQIGVRGAELVAVMEYLWLQQIATGERVPDTDLSLVVECMQGRITRAPADPTAHITVLQHGCREFARLWHLLDDKEAA
ncbi:MAG TPA: hypothetical protein VHE81_03790 [Lacipirellulaceae bacterium]|nr:hypothetical protein [Lacipirellulaceae bacterium]